MQKKKKEEGEKKILTRLRMRATISRPTTTGSSFTFSYFDIYFIISVVMMKCHSLLEMKANSDIHIIKGVKKMHSP